MPMSIAELGSIGEFVGSVAILVTLVYLAIQTTLTRREMSSTALNNIFASFKSVNQAVIGSEEVALLYEKGLREPNSLTRGEKLRFFMLVREAANAYLALFRQFKAGIVDEATWKGVAFDVYASTPGVRAFLEEQSELYDEEFVAYYRAIKPYPPSDAVTFMVGRVDA